MDKDKIIDGLRMTMDLCVFDPSTGEEIEPHLLNDISRATYDACKGALEILEQLPPAQPERIRGHWIEISLSNNTYKCSVCGRLLVNITDGKNKVAKNYPYCHCGADMRGEQNEP